MTIQNLHVDARLCLCVVVEGWTVGTSLCGDFIEMGFVGKRLGTVHHMIVRKFLA